MTINRISFPGEGSTPSSINFGQNSGTQYVTQLYGQAQPVALAPSETFIIPQGQYIATHGLYTNIQYFDPAPQVWRNLRSDRGPFLMVSDGANFRFANLSGCPVGAVVTTGGASASNVAGFYPAATTGGVAPNAAYTCVPSAGGSTWNFWVGGAVNTSVTITAAGTLYTAAPVLVILPPANQGSTPYIPATGYCTISGGVINAVTITNQGAGYVSAPTIAVVNAAGDTTGSGGVLTAALTAATAVTAVVMATPGSVRTTVPTLTITTPGGSPAATVVMNFSLDVIATIGGAGAAYGTSLPFTVTAAGGQITTTPTYTNPAFEKGLTTPRQPYITGVCEAGGTIIVADLSLNLGSYMDFGAGFQTSPTLIFNGTGATLNTSRATATTVVGGQNDVCYLDTI